MRRGDGLHRLTLGMGAASVLLIGCTVGPKYTTPTPPAPAGDTFASAAATIAAADQPPPNWWKLYNTPALDDLVKEALTHNKNLLAAAANLRYARAALSLARAGRYPTATISAGSQEGVTADTLFARRLEGLTGAPRCHRPLQGAGLDASYEIDLFGRIHRAVQAAAADYQAQKAAEDATRISVAGETTRAYVNACAYAQELAVANESLNLVTQNYEVIQKQAQFGAASDFDVARARQLVAQTRAAVPAFEGQRRTALFELAVLTGRTPEEISQAADRCKAPPKLTTVLPVGDARPSSSAGPTCARPNVSSPPMWRASAWRRLTFIPPSASGGSGVDRGERRRRPHLYLQPQLRDRGRC